MGLPALLLVALVGWGARTPAAAPANTAGAASPLAQADEAPSKPAKDKSTVARRAAKGALIATDWTAHEWALPSPVKRAETAVSQGVSSASTARLASAPSMEAQHNVAHVPRWGVQLTANWSEARAGRLTARCKSGLRR
jgi:hypothetical protein